MGRGRAIRVGIKWACTVLAVAIVTATASSRWWQVCWFGPNGRGGLTGWGIGHGRIAFVRFARAVGPRLGWDLDRHSDWVWGWRDIDTSGGTSHALCGFTWFHPPGLFDAYGMTLLYPAALLSTPAALLWYADRRRSAPGRCPKCNYDRAGLDPHAKCPECGALPAQ